MEFFSKFAKIGLRTDDFDQGILKVENKWRDFGTSMTDIAGDIFSIRKVIGAAAKDLGSASISMEKQWEQSANTINASFSQISENTTNQMNAFSEKIRTVGNMRPYLQKLNDTMIQVGSSMSGLSSTPFLNQVLPAFSSELSTFRSIASELSTTISFLENIKKAYKGTVGLVTNAIKGIANAKQTQKDIIKSLEAVTAANKKLEKARLAHSEVVIRFGKYRRLELESRAKAERLMTVANKGGAGAEKLRAKATLATAKADRYAKLAILNRKKVINAQLSIDKAQTAATTAQSAATAAQTGITKKATIAQLAQNIAMKANPIGAVIAAIVALVAATKLLVRWMNRETDESRRARIERERNIEVINRLNASIDSSANAHRERTAAIQTDLSISQRLIESINELTSAESLSAAERARLTMYTNQLTDVMPELLDYIDEETSLLNLTTEALLQQSEARAGQLKYDAARERSLELAQEEYNLSRQLEIAAKDHAAAVYELSNSVSKGSQILSFVFTPVAIASMITMRNATEAVEEQAAAYEELRQNLEDNIREQELYADAMVDAYMRMAEAAEKYTKTATIAIHEMTDEQRAALDELADIYTEVKNAAREMFRAMSNESELSLEDVENNLKNNIAVVDQWGLDLAKLGGAAGEGLYEGFIEYLHNLGVDGAAEIRMFAHALENDPQGLQRISDLFEQGGATAINAIVNAFGYDHDILQQVAQLAISAGDALQEAIENAGFDAMGVSVVKSFAEAIEDNARYAYNAAAAVAGSAMQGMKDTLEMNSPSLVFKRYGENTVNSYANGVLSEKETAIDAVSDMGKALVQIGSKNVQRFAAAIDGVNSAGASKLESASNWLRRYSGMLNITAQEEIDIWESLTYHYAKNTHERWQIDQNTARLREQIDRDSFNHSKHWIEERQFLGELSLREELAAWERVQSRYLEGSQERADADRRVHTARLNLMQEEQNLRDQIEQADQRYWQAVEQRANSILSPFNIFDHFTRREDTSREDAAIAARNQYASIEQQIQRLQEDSQRQLERNHQQTMALRNDDRLSIEERASRERELNAERVQLNADLRQSEIDLMEAQKKAREEMLAAEEEAAKTKQEVLKRSLQSQFDELESYQNNISELARREGMGENFDQFVNYIKQLGVAANAELYALNEKTPEQLADYVDLWHRKHELARNLAVGELQTLREEVDKEIGKLTTQLDYLTGGIEAPVIFNNAEYNYFTTESMIDEQKALFDSGFSEITSIVTSAFTTMSRTANDIVRNMMSTLDTLLRHEGFNLGRSFAQELGQGLISQEAALLRQAMSTASAIRSAFGNSNSGGFTPAGSFATGLLRVPYDNFPAVLHKNEMVLTAAQADEYRQGDTGGDTVNLYFYGVRERETGYAAYRGYQKAQLALGRR